MKNWKRLAIILLCAIVFTASTLLVACKDKKPEQDDPTINYDSIQDKISMIVSVNAEKINVRLSSTEEAGNATVNVVSTKAYEYLAADSYKGLASAGTATVVGEYTLGKDETLTVNRYVNGYDNLYNKYYVVDSEGAILKGPVYATEVCSSVTEQPTLLRNTKKGIVGTTDVNEMKELGAENATLNFNVENMFYPNEMWDDGVRTELELTNAQMANAIEFVSNGVTYYFRKNVVASYDARIKQLYAAGANITAVLHVNNNGAARDGESFPTMMTYAPYSTMDTATVSINTSNSYGFNYYVALMEFVASRYTFNVDGKFTNGFISTFVIGSQIDIASTNNRISEGRAQFDTYMEEYSRLLRISNLAVKKYHSDINVAMPLSNAWATAASQDDYAPKTMIEWLNNKTKLEGDYDWGIAPSIFSGSTTSQIFEYDIDSAITNKGLTADYNTSAIISISNVELLDMFLNAQGVTFDGVARRVYLTEYGVSGSGNYGDTERRDDNGELIQAGVIAATWYKVSQLDSIVCYNYFCFSDANDGGASSFGLVSDDVAIYKPSYMVWKYIDTQYSQTVAGQYVSYVTYYKDGELVTPTSYAELLNTLGTSYNVSTIDWSKAAPREIATIYDWESVGNMDGNYALDGSFIADGYEHTITVGVRDGVTVRYSVNGGEFVATKPTRSAVGCDTVIVQFYEGNVLLGTRQVLLNVGAKVETNKSVYNYGEKILFNVALDVNFTRQAWVGLIAAENWNNGTYLSDQMGLVATTRVFKDQYLTHTYSFDSFVIDGVKQATLPAGEYYVFCSNNGSYFNSLGGVFKIKVLAEGEDSGLDDLSAVKFTDKKFDVVEGQQTPCNIYVTGISDEFNVEYVNNGQTAAGVYNVCALISKDGVLLEKRYAVMTLQLAYDDVSLDKTDFVYGEAIYVTAIANVTNAERTLKVGLFAKDTDTLIAFYYVKDTAQGHLSGRAFNLLSADALISGSPFLTTVGNYKMLVTGEYTIRLYVDDQDAFKSIDVTVHDALSFELNKNSYEMNEDVLVTAYGIPQGGSPLFKGTLQVILFSANDINPLTNAGVYPIFTINVDEVNTGNAVVLQGQNPSIRPFGGKLPAGEYVLYMVITDNDGTYNVIGEAQSFTIVGDDDDYPTPITILNGEDVDGIPHFGPMDDIKVKIDMRTVAYGEFSAWIIVCPVTENNWSNYYLYYWDYITGPHSSLNLGDDGLFAISSAKLTGGDYKIVLFYDGNYNVLATTNFSLEEMGEVNYYIVEGGSSFAYGETIHVKVDPTNLRADAWLGIFSDAWRNNPGYEGSYQSVETVTLKELAANDYVWEIHLPTTKGVVSGINWIVLFRGEGAFIEATDPIQINVTPDPSLVKAPEIVGGGNTFERGAVVEIQFYTDYLFESAWLALYTAYRYDKGFSYDSWKYISDLASNDYVYVLDTAGIFAGDYVLVLFIDEGHVEAATLRFTITGDVKGLDIVGGTTTFKQGDTIQLKVANLQYFIDYYAAPAAWLGIWVEGSYLGAYTSDYIGWAWVYIDEGYNVGHTEHIIDGIWNLNTSALSPGTYVVAVIVGGGGSPNKCEVVFTIEAASSTSSVSTESTVAIDYFVDTTKRNAIA